MITAIVTWTTYNNYGTLLQAYALQKCVEQLGHECELLSDELILKEYRANKPKPPQKPTPAQTSPESGSRWRSLLSDPQRLGRVITAHLDKEAYALPYEGSQKSCEAFKKTELTIREGISGADLAQLNDDYDAFICGSDQVWSVFDSIFNPYYYLDFAKKRKIAYAPSMGTDKISDETAEKIKALLSDFAAVSVRESVSARKIAELTGREVEWVCDPTLLHDRAFWETFSDGAEKPRGKYLLCYFLENKPWYFDYAKRLADRLHLRIKLIPNKWDYLSNGNVVKTAVGPREFVSLFRNADYVLTDSYHGSIFSMIFGRDFLYLQRFSEHDPNSQNIRVDSLFGYLGIESRMVSSETIRFDGLNMEDYERINEKLSAFRDKSRTYLATSLGE